MGPSPGSQGCLDAYAPVNQRFNRRRQAEQTLLPGIALRSNLAADVRHR